MGLQINRPSTEEGVGGPGGPGGGDDWGTRVAKLIPAEALGLYGAAVALVPADTPSRDAGLWLIALVCAGLLILIRYRSARDPSTGKPQMVAILISLISFFIWLLALGAPVSPIRLPADLTFFGPLAALLWGTVVPYIYKG